MSRPPLSSFVTGTAAQGALLAESASPTYASDVAFTPSVKAVQSRKGSRRAYARMEERGSWETRITPDLASFIAAQTSAFLATASAAGQPYIQHRGGPAGFLKVLDDKTIGFADFVGASLSDRLCAAPAHQDLGRGARRRGRRRPYGKVAASRLPGASRPCGPLHRLGLGRELPSAHPATLRSRRCCRPARRARQTHRRFGSRGRATAKRCI